MNFTSCLFLWILTALLPARTTSATFFGKVVDLYKNVMGRIPIDYIKCTYMECCNEEYVFPNIHMLDAMLQSNLYGQEIVRTTVVNALRGHIMSADPPKALAMSFHGTPGTGKTYVAKMIAKSLYKKGEDSQYFHFFNGRNDFPLERKVEEYKEQLQQTILDSLTMCDMSMFVFDEVDKMPEGLLNVLIPFLDYNAWHKSWRYTSNASVYKHKAIYIFLSNTGSSRIVQRLLELWKEGRQRHATKIQDFENLISVGAFNEKGGFHHSDTIETSVIDHYIPFLPLEEAHVISCIKKAYLDREVTPTDDMIDETMSHVTFGPPPYNLYATSGCKRLEQKVAATVYSRRKKMEL